MKERTADQEFDDVGKRYKIRVGVQDLGLGTYLWMGEYLLDTGRKIREEDCQVEGAIAGQVPAFDIRLAADARVFEDSGRSLIRCGDYFLPTGERLHIEKIAVKPWNHGGYVAGKITYRDEPYWLIMSEIEFTPEPQLKLVG